MDKKLKTKWLKALRSGKYKQAKGTLRSDDGKFCCLGVLCDVIDPTAWRSPSIGGPRTAAAFVHTHGDGALNGRGMRESGVGIRHEGVLIAMNDGGKRFSTIARYIEENL